MYNWDYDLEKDWQPQTKKEWLWYLERKINYDDWQGLKTKTIAEHFALLKNRLDFGKKELLKHYFKKYGHTFAASKKDVLFEHPNIKKQRRYKNILCDSLSDAAANKVMAFFDRNDPKDLFDLYFLLKKYKLKELLKLVEKKFGVLFPQSAFWSEIYKALKDLKTLKPFLLAENKTEKERLINKIKDYFINRSTRYLHRLLS